MIDILSTVTPVIAEAAAETAKAVAASGISGSIAAGLGALGGAIGVGIIGFKACESVGRNPNSSGKVLTQSIIAMALAEGIAILSLLLG